MTDSGHQISQRVDNYIKYRPRYPAAVLDLLRDECGLTPTHVIADVGSGTGILSHLFLENGNPVFGVEPDPDMRAGAERVLSDFPNFVSLAAAAEATSLPDQSIDFVAAGQSFHWFDLRRARNEFRRVLAPNGWTVLVWNAQRTGGTPFLDALQAFWEDERFVTSRPPSPSHPPLEKQKRAQAYRRDPDLLRRELLDPFYGPGAYAERRLDNPLPCDLAALRGRILSNAPALQPADPLFESMLAAIDEIFHTHQVGGSVTIDHDTWLVYGRLPAST